MLHSFNKIEKYRVKMELSMIFLGFLGSLVVSVHGKSCQVTVNNTITEFTLATYLDCDLPMNVVRKTLVKENWMYSDNYFQNKNSICVDQNIEKGLTLQDFLVKDTLTIGHPNKEKTFLEKFLKGFTIKNGLVESTTHTLCSFDEGYIPTENDPQTTLKYETSLAFSSETVHRQTSGIDAASLSLSTPWVDASAEFKKEQSKTNGQGKVTAYLTTRSVYSKTSVEVDVKKLLIRRNFRNKLDMAIIKHEREDSKPNLEQFEELVAVLNKYGWYIVTEYTLGGGFFITEEKEASSYEEAHQQEITAKAEASAKFGSFGGSGGYEHGSKDGSSNASEKKSEQMSFNQIGGSSSAQLSKEKFQTDLEKRANWRIIYHKKFVPSLLLLHKSKPDTLQKCVKILEEFWETYGHIFQRNIDFPKYLASLSEGLQELQE